MLTLLLVLGIQLPPVSKETPNRQPQLASQGASVGVAYGAGNTIYFASSADRGQTFASPVAVSSRGQLSLGMHRGPRIAYTRNGVVISAIVGEQGKGKDGDLMAWRSVDGGKTWSEPARVNDVAGSAREGLHAMASGGKDSVFAAWLDMRAEGTRIYGAASADGGATWSPDRLVYESPSGTVCQCCHPSVAVDESGGIFVMFRNAVEGSRDLYLARSEDGGKTFQAPRKLGTGTWKLEGCPMDGGGLAVAPGGQVATIWRRDRTVFTTRSDGPEAALGSGKNPTLVAASSGFHAAWTEGQTVMMRKPGAEKPEIAGEDGAFPSMTALSDGSVVMAWESRGAIAIHTVSGPQGGRRSGEPGGERR